MNLKDKLRSMQRHHNHSEKRHKHMHEFDVAEIAEQLGGEIVRFAGGHFIRINHSLSGTAAQGMRSVTNLAKIPGKSIAILAKNKVPASFSFRDAVFIDTETTGLAGGSGTYAFLVGIGYFSEENFVVEQLFMPELSHEASLLKYLDSRLANRTGLVSFNGKSYDIPLLTTRFIQNRIRSLLDLQPNFDVLHAARRIWKNDFGDCTLLTLENRLLGIERSGDVPGAEIPGIYMEYLKSKKPDNLINVIYHNRMDILSMAGIIQCLFELMHPQPGSRTEPVSREKRMASLLEATDEMASAIARYERLLKMGSLSPDDKLDALFTLSMIYKKRRNWEKAEKCWLQMINEVKFSILAAIELAKYYEHKKKDYQAAQNLVDRCLSIIDLRAMLATANQRELKDALIRRRDRLIKKMARIQ